MNSRNGLTLVMVTLLLLTAALLNHDGTRRAVGIGWRVIDPVLGPRMEAVVRRADDLLGRMRGMARSGRGGGSGFSIL